MPMDFGDWRTLSNNSFRWCRFCFCVFFSDFWSSKSGKGCKTHMTFWVVSLVLRLTNTSYWPCHARKNCIFEKKPSIPSIPDETRLSTTMPALQTTKRVSVVVKWWPTSEGCQHRMNANLSLCEKFCIGCMWYWWAPTWLTNYPLKTNSQSPRK